ncbi:MAG: hypothetical protein IKF16_00755 [Lachnospiraceae bacterium]|nr:hypothetical protein [Lachnospiraceae bacterium]
MNTEVRQILPMQFPKSVGIKMELSDVSLYGASGSSFFCALKTFFEKWGTFCTPWLKCLQELRLYRRRSRKSSRKPAFLQKKVGKKGYAPCLLDFRQGWHSGHIKRKISQGAFLEATLFGVSGRRSE